MLSKSSETDMNMNERWRLLAQQNKTPAAEHSAEDDRRVTERTTDRLTNQRANANTVHVFSPMTLHTYI